MASRNRKKLAELRRVLDAAGISGLTLLSLDDVGPFDEAPETGATFEDNAVAKARDAFRATGLATVADDSCTGRMRPTRRCCSHSFVTCPTIGAAQRSCRHARWRTARGKRWCAVDGRALLRENRGAAVDLATTRCSFPRGRHGRRQS